MFVVTLFIAGDNRLRQVSTSTPLVRETDTGAAKAARKAMADLKVQHLTPVAKIELRSLEFTGVYGHWWIAQCSDCGIFTKLAESASGRVTVPHRRFLRCAGCENEAHDGPYTEAGTIRAGKVTTTKVGANPFTSPECRGCDLPIAVGETYCANCTAGAR